ncbi:MAG: hypothetical protein Q4B54_07940 [Coriobacteriales bacterium]|nr:hypothetical protein [Coriobacteriales bacterium]
MAENEVENLDQVEDDNVLEDEQIGEVSGGLPGMPMPAELEYKRRKMIEDLAKKK